MGGTFLGAEKLQGKKGKRGNSFTDQRYEVVRPQIFFISVTVTDD